MNSNIFYSPQELMSVILPMVGDTDNKMYSKGLYISLIQKALEELAIDSFFDEQRKTLDFPYETLTMPLPQGCFNMRNVYLLNGTECDISETMKVYWKRNYFTRGTGYAANDKGHNGHDPFYTHRGNGGTTNHYDKRFIRANEEASVNHAFFYNIQGGNIMFSPSCRGKTNKVHLHYNGIGGAIDEVPIIPLFARAAIEDYVIESVLRMRMAAESDRKWSSLWQIYEKKLNRDGQYGFGGSWMSAEYRVKTLNTSQRQELFLYLGSPSKGSGF